MLIYRFKNIQENGASKAESQFLPQNTFDRFKVYLFNHFRFNKYFDLPQEDIAILFGVTLKTIKLCYKQLRDDPCFFVGEAIRRKGSHKFHTIKIALNKITKKLLVEYVPQLSLFKGYNLLKNNPLPLKGDTAVLKSEASQEKKPKRDKRSEKATIIVDLGRRYRMHYTKETLKLFAYPLDILRAASEELSSAIAEGIRIRSPFRYLRKILDTFMARKGLRPLWGIYYKELAIVNAKPKAPQPPFRRPPSPQLPRPKVVIYEEKKPSQGAMAIKDVLAQMGWA